MYVYSPLSAAIEVNLMRKAVLFLAVIVCGVQIAQGDARFACMLPVLVLILIFRRRPARRR